MLHWWVHTSNGTQNRNRRMRNRMYGGVRGRKTKVGEKLLRFPPTRSITPLMTALVKPSAPWRRDLWWYNRLEWEPCRWLCLGVLHLMEWTSRFARVLLPYIHSISPLYKLFFDLVLTSCQPKAKLIEVYCQLFRPILIYRNIINI